MNIHNYLIIEHMFMEQITSEARMIKHQIELPIGF